MSAAPTVKDRLLNALVSVLPQHLLSRGMYLLARNETTWVKNAIIRFIVKRFKVNVDEARNSDPLSYASFNAFFTRELKEGARPITQEGVASPSDGVVSQCGRIVSDRIIQAKGHEYSLYALLAGDGETSAQFENGDFATIYLSPRDYHRVHMPLGGTLREMVFVPGDLYSVSEATAQLVPGLFARNERVVCLFDTARGPMAVILVGAIFVGSMDTVWAGEVKAKGNTPTRWQYAGDDAPHFETGDEIGRFNMGSTVIVLFPQHAADMHESLRGQFIHMGEKLAD